MARNLNRLKFKRLRYQIDVINTELLQLLRALNLEYRISKILGRSESLNIDLASLESRP